MFKAERIQKIKELVFNRKQVDVATLSALLDVSGVTIRSDLERLEESGYLQRTHGGAVLNESSTSQEGVNNNLLGKTIRYDKTKESIGQIAAALIEENEWIFLGPGETCYYIAKQLCGRKNINILTNNIYVVNALLGSSGVNVIMAGGNLNHERRCVLGDIFTKSVEDIYLRKAFFSVAGADFQAGYTVSGIGEMNLIKFISQKTGDLIFLVDPARFGIVSFMSVGDLKSVPTVMSGHKMPEAYKKYYFEHNIRVFTPYDLNPMI
jgi:DeoR/GlpR family transcriptional regulator of sugar metabolism